ncbi:MAG: 16S rRNA (cytosine(1402)-N(4))-methyltransferase, partial [Kiritimatiellaeota bacterium]|nr:16S rRNA (cytosine(1402)-N(4))-methyltransferase [Kiritimatiellota bacterium]
RRVAKAVARERARGAIETTGRLAEIVCAALGRWGGRRHPATHVFQALRMAVNREIEDLRRALEDGLTLLRPGGRIAVIAFERLTERLTKQRFAAHVGTWTSLQQGGKEWIGELPAAVPVTRKAVTPSEEEIRGNPRARSAQLRAVERKD